MKTEYYEVLKDPKTGTVARDESGDVKVAGPLPGIYAKTDGTGYVQVLESKVVAEFDASEIMIRNL